MNKNLKNADAQYIILSKWKNPNEGYEIATLGALANYYRYDGITSNVSKENKAFREGIQMGDSTFLNIYGVHLLYGNAAAALNQPFTVVITEDKAKKYFGKADVIGKL